MEIKKYEVTETYYSSKVVGILTVSNIVSILLLIITWIIK